MPSGSHGRSNRLSGHFASARRLEPFPDGFAKGAFRAVPGMRHPVLQHCVSPRYPPEITDPVATDVEVLVVVGADGGVAGRVLYAPDPRDPFEREALAAARQYVFEPGALDGRPVPIVVTLLIPFHPATAARDHVRVVGGTADPPSRTGSRLQTVAACPGPGLLRPLPISKVYPRLTPSGPAPICGRVEMLAIIGTDGRIEDIEVTRPLDGAALDSASLASVEQWTFEPALKDGHPVPVVVAAFVSFNEPG